MNAPHCICAAAVVACVVSPGAQAGVDMVAGMSAIRTTLVDLDPGDGTTPWIALDDMSNWNNVIGLMVTPSPDGSPGSTSQATSGGPSFSSQAASLAANSVSVGGAITQGSGKLGIDDAASEVRAVTTPFDFNGLQAYAMTATYLRLSPMTRVEITTVADLRYTVTDEPAFPGGPLPIDQRAWLLVGADLSPMSAGLVGDGFVYGIGNRNATRMEWPVSTPVFLNDGRILFTLTLDNATQSEGLFALRTGVELEGHSHVVPEPAAVMLMGSGLLLLAVSGTMRRTRRPPAS